MSEPNNCPPGEETHYCAEPDPWPLAQALERAEKAERELAEANARADRAEAERDALRQQIADIAAELRTVTPDRAELPRAVQLGTDVLRVLYAERLESLLADKGADHDGA